MAPLFPLVAVALYFLQLNDLPAASASSAPVSHFAATEAPPPTPSRGCEIGFDLDHAVPIVAVDGITEDLLLLRTFM